MKFFENRESFRYKYIFKSYDEIKSHSLSKFVLHYVAKVGKFSDDDFDDLVQILNDFSEEKIVNFVNEIMLNPALAKILIPLISKLITITIRAYGLSKDNWSPFAIAIFSKLSVPDIQKKRSPVISQFLADWKKERLRLKKAVENNERIHEVEYSIGDILAKGKFLRLQGRTLLFEAEDKIIAVKLQKKDESILELHKQKNAAKFLNENKEQLKLQSQYPTPLAVVKVNGINEFITQLEKTNPLAASELKSKIAIDSNAIFAYMYEVKESNSLSKEAYFTYLHDPSLTLDQFFDAMQRGINDILIFFKNGLVYHQLADLLHDQHLENMRRTDHGRFLALVNLLTGSKFGTGKIQNLIKAVEFLNLRLSGAADEGDFHKLETFLKKGGKFSKKFFEPLSDSHVPAELLAQILVVIELTAISYALQSIEKNKSIDTDAFWEKLSVGLLQLYHSSFALLSGLPTTYVQEFFHNDAWNPIRYAKQLRYFMTDRCVKDILQGKVESGIFSDLTKVTVTPVQDGEYMLKGFIDNGKRGPHSGSGQHPIKEGDFIRYSFVTFLFGSAKTLDDFQECLHTAKKLAREGKSDAKTYFQKAEKIHPLMFNQFQKKIANQHSDKEEKYSAYRKFI